MTSPTLTAGHLSDVGRQREANEDSYWVPPPNFDPALLGRKGALYLVADGMGGHQGGQRASQLAASIVPSTFYSAPAADPRQSLDQALRTANIEILREARSNTALYNMGTTAVAAVIQGNRLLIAHVGDSRAYRLRAGQLQQLTADHSFVEEGMRRGEVTAEEAATHPYRGVITRALGAKPELQPDYLELDWQPGDVLLLCSDGLSNTVTDPELADILLTSKSAQQAAQRLIDTANQHGGPDNITAVVLSYGQPAAAASKGWLPLLAGIAGAMAVLAVVAVIAWPRPSVPPGTPGAAVSQTSEIVGEPERVSAMTTVTSSATLTTTPEVRAEGIISLTQTTTAETAPVQAAVATTSVPATATPLPATAAPPVAPPAVQLSPPALTGPEDGWSAPIGSVTFAWNPVPGATGYIVETRSERAGQTQWTPWPKDGGGASSLQLYYETNASYFQIPGTVYTWRVVPLGRGGQRGQPSVERKFEFRQSTAPADTPEPPTPVPPTEVPPTEVPPTEPPPTEPPPTEPPSPTDTRSPEAPQRSQPPELAGSPGREETALLLPAQTITPEQVLRVVARPQSVGWVVSSRVDCQHGSECNRYGGKVVAALAMSRSVPDNTQTIEENRAFLPIVLGSAPGVPTLNAIQNVDGDGTYTVTWSVVSSAITYTLQEAIVGVVASPTPAYIGEVASRTFTDRGPARYVYQVRASNRNGDSAWSDAQAVDVLVEREPNDFYTQANGPLISELPLPYRGRFSTATDRDDYFYIVLQATGNIDVSLTNIALGENYDLILRNDAGQIPGGYSGLPGNSDEHVLLQSQPPGRYYARVFNRSGTVSAHEYHLRVVYP